MRIEPTDGVTPIEVPERPPRGKKPAQNSADVPTQASPTLLQPHEDEVKMVVEGQRIIYRFVDKKTGETILQVPPEQLLSVMRGIEEQLQRQGERKQISE